MVRFMTCRILGVNIAVHLPQTVDGYTGMKPMGQRGSRNPTELRSTRSSDKREETQHLRSEVVGWRREAWRLFRCWRT